MGFAGSGFEDMVPNNRKMESHLVILRYMQGSMLASFVKNHGGEPTLSQSVSYLVERYGGASVVKELSKLAEEPTDVEDLKAELRRLVELRDKAEPGPWSNQFHRAEVRRYKTLVVECRKSPHSFAKGHCDGDFITACGNTDFAAVLERLESLEAENERLRERLPSPDMMSN